MNSKLGSFLGNKSTKSSFANETFNKTSVFSHTKASMMKKKPSVSKISLHNPSSSVKANNMQRCISPTTELEKFQQKVGLGQRK
jgi:hypothetical protein